MGCRLALVSLSAFFLFSCQKETQVDRATREGILLVGNSAEPKALDFHQVTGVIESKVIDALFEGLVANDAEKDDATPPGAAASWEHNTDMTDWTFKLQPEGKWSDGVPVTARDFVFAYHRLLHPDQAGPYAEMLYFIENAEVYNKNQRGRILVHANQVPGVVWEEVSGFPFGPDLKVNVADMGEKPKWEDAITEEQRGRFVRSKGLDALGGKALEWVSADPLNRFTWPAGVDAVKVNALVAKMTEMADADLFDLAKVGVSQSDDLTLRVKLREPVPFLPSLTRHYTWFPVPEHVVLKYGKISDRFTEWSNFPHIVGNGPFKLIKWRYHDVIEVDRNPQYWDKENVGINGIRFLPIENPYTETRAFLSGQLHTTYQLPSDLIQTMKKDEPQYLRQEPYVGTMFVRFNTTRPALSDPRVRQALSLAIDRKQLCEHILEGFEPATSLTPKMGSYQPDPALEFNPEKARQLLAEAGFANGDKFPRFSVLIARASTRATVEAIQAMWKQHLNVLVEIQNKDWGSYVTAQQSLDFDMAAAAWIGDYLDPTTFLGMWTKGNGNNNTGWSNEEYEKLLRDAALQADPAQRLSSFRKAEGMLMDAQPIAPLAVYARNYLHRPEVKNWHPLLLDHHPWKATRLESNTPAAEHAR
jgi:oligopeptide transport system substrate-binding protein